jgi:hypothetical protein
MKIPREPVRRSFSRSDKNKIASAVFSFAIWKGGMTRGSTEVKEI